jgi:hypothetical protein
MFNRITNACAIIFTGATVGSVAIVAPAFASSRARSPVQSVESAARVHGAAGIGQGTQGTTVYSRGRYVGRDPDPSIRGQLLRDDFRDRSM